MPRTPWEEISIDIIGPLPRSEDKNAILFIVDQFFKIIRLITNGHLLFVMGALIL